MICSLSSIVLAVLHFHNLKKNKKQQGHMPVLPRH